MKTVKISELKAHLAKYLRMVKNGEVVDILDRDVWVARLVGAMPSNTVLEIRKPIKDPAGIRKLKSKAKPSATSSSLDDLMEERKRR